MAFTDQTGNFLYTTLRDAVLCVETRRRRLEAWGTLRQGWSHECILEDGKPLCSISQDGHLWRLVPRDGHSVHRTRGIWGEHDRFIGYFHEILMADIVFPDGKVMCVGMSPFIQTLDAVLQFHLTASSVLPSIAVEL